MLLLSCIADGREHASEGYVLYRVGRVFETASARAETLGALRVETLEALQECLARGWVEEVDATPRPPRLQLSVDGCALFAWSAKVAAMENQFIYHRFHRPLLEINRTG